MKKLFALAAAVLMGLGAAHAEGWSVGGTVSAWRDLDTKNTTVTFTPEGNYTLNDTWKIGAQIGYKYVGNDSYTNNSFVINPYTRYTFYRTGSLSLICDGCVDISLGGTSYASGGSADTSFGIGIGLKPGVTLDVAKNFTLVAHFGFLGYQDRNKAGRYVYPRGFGFKFSDAVNFGCYYNF